MICTGMFGSGFRIGFDEKYYSRSDRVDPQGPTSGDVRVRRGGHYGHVTCGVRSAYRHLYVPENRSKTIGVAPAQDRGGLIAYCQLRFRSASLSNNKKTRQCLSC